MATCAMASVGTELPLDPRAAQAVAAGTLVYDADAAQACFDTIALFTCDRTDAPGRPTTASELGINPPACGTIVHGADPFGARCVIGDACTCEPGGAQPLALGDACDSNDRCPDGAFCTNPATQTTMICAALLPRDAPCDAGADLECAVGLACVADRGVATCQPLPGLGEPCPHGRCRDEGVTCSAGTCVAAGLDGAPCSAAADCSRFYACDATGHCAPGPRLGEACTFYCFDPDAYCDLKVGTCIARAPDGTPCGSQFGRNDNACRSRYCVPDADPRLGTCGSPAACP
jgi:hypothetical protein